MLSEANGTPMIYVLIFLFYIGVKSINNVVIASGRQQRHSVIHIRVSILLQTPLLSRLPQNVDIMPSSMKARKLRHRGRKELA